ncbi:hypothetical protein Daesc_008857 [Daldinia eschscholtzii]|uniref:Uncharacterized protein n=1 Tax=Daldinia eschscholtzii TaxID=292717 RepID=A0AAX6MD05_9PEZI
MDLAEVVEDFYDGDLHVITEYLRNSIGDQGGVVGFAPTFLPDADDTAKSLLALTTLGVQIDRAPLIRNFEGDNHFKTYELEGSPSVSVNCNVLLALLTSPHVDQYVPQIEKATRFCMQLLEFEQTVRQVGPGLRGTVHAAGFRTCQLLNVYAHGSLRNLAADVVRIDVPIIFVQLLNRALSKQRGNGSWEDSVERTSYGALPISYALKLPWPVPMRLHAEAALLKAKRYLEAHSGQWATGDYAWISKVTYKLPTNAEAYCLAAMKSPGKEQSWASQVEQLFDIDAIKMKNMANFYSHLPLLQSLSETTMAFVIHEAVMYFNRLRQVRLNVFPRDVMAVSADDYLEYIPVAWTTINAVNGFALSGDEMWEMIMISMLNYQVDEYMESVVARLDEPSSQLLGMIGTEIRHSKPLLPTNSSPQSVTFQPTVFSTSQSDSGSPPRSLAFEDVVEVLSKYIRHVKWHSALMKSPETAQLCVIQELQKFLLAHIAHNADNIKLRKHQHDRGRASVDWHDQAPHYDWVHTTGANDMSCPFSFTFFRCLSSTPGSHYLASIDQRYLAREMCLHFATLRRQYNDYGSVIRDDAEGNLNSLHFPELTDKDRQSLSSLMTVEGSGREGSLERGKDLLMKMANIERTFMQVCWEALSSSLGEAVKMKLKTFIDVTDLFGQIYVARDIASKAM